MPASVSPTRLEALVTPLNRGSIDSAARTSDRPGSTRSEGSRHGNARGGAERERKEYLITRLLKAVGRRWTEQRLPALYIKDKIPHIVCVNLLATCGILFVALGFALLSQSWGVQEYVYDYTDLAEGAEKKATGDLAVGSFEIEIRNTLIPPIWVYYEIDGFYQNHRNYAGKIDRAQLRGDPNYESPEHGPCGDVYRNPRDGRVYHPCGQIAATVFKDSFSVLIRKPDFEGFGLLQVEQQATSIAWPEDVYGKWAFRNLDPEGKHKSGVENQVALDMWLLEHFPPVECKQVNFTARKYAPVKVAKKERGGKQVAACTGYKSWTPKCEFERDGKPFACTKESGYEEVKVAAWGVESGHFLVWTRLAAWPKFRKAWGVISSDEVPRGSTLRVHFTDEFEVKSYGGRKAFVICDSSPIGGKTKIGWAYFLVGTLMLMYWVQFRLPSEGL